MLTCSSIVYEVPDDMSELDKLLEHPTIAKENAINYFGINEKEQNIIESHMFPISNVIPAVL